MTFCRLVFNTVLSKSKICTISNHYCPTISKPESKMQIINVNTYVYHIITHYNHYNMSYFQ